MKSSLPYLLTTLFSCFGCVLSSAQVTPAPSSFNMVENAQAPRTEQDAQEKEQREFQETLTRLGAIQSGEGNLGSHATVQIPDGYIFFPEQGAKELMKSYGNMLSNKELGLIASPGFQWQLLFEFDPIGYVEDKEKDQLNADEMMKVFKENEPHINKTREEHGLPKQEILGFAIPPRYNEANQALEWAIRVRFEGSPGETINFNTKRLGRHGVMDLTLLVDPEDLQKSLPEFEQFMKGFAFSQGNTYAEYRQGDRLATLGLTGLVIGGAGYAAAKTGLIGGLLALISKGGKALIAGAVAVLYGIFKIFGKIFGGRKLPNVKDAEQ